MSPWSQCCTWQPTHQLGTVSFSLGRLPSRAIWSMLVSGSVPLFWTLCFSLEQVLEWPHVWFGCPKSANHHPATVNTMKSTLHDLSFLCSSILSREYYIMSVPQCVFSVPRTSCKPKWRIRRQSTRRLPRWAVGSRQRLEHFGSRFLIIKLDGSQLYIMGT